MAESYIVPFVATTNAIISSADANAGYAGNIRYFRQFISNPAGSNLVLLASGTDSASFQKVPDAAMTEQKVNQLNPNYTGFAAPTDKGSGFFDVAGTASDAPVAGQQTWLVWQARHRNWGADYRGQLTANFGNQNHLFYRNVQAGAAQPWVQLWHSGNDGAGSGLDADMLDGMNAGNASGQIPVSNGTMNANLNAERLGGQLGSFYATAAGLAAINSVPSGLIGAFRSAAAIAAGWARCDGSGGRPNMNGRMLAGAGNVGGLDLAEGSTGGTSWSHGHGVGSYAASGAPGGPVQGGGSSSASPADHGHAVTGSSESVQWLPPLVVIVWAIKS